MPIENQTTDLRDLYIKLNPLGLDDQDLAVDGDGFEHPATQNDFIAFRAGYEATRETQHALAEPVGEVIAFGFGLHEVSWAKGRMPALGTKLYTHANPAEVERLRQKVSDLTVSGHQEYMRCEKMRAQLAEAQALLAEARTLLHQVTALGGKKIGTLYSHSLHMGHRINAALSASTEPSAAESDFSKQKHDVWRRAFYGEESEEPSNDLCAEGAHEFVPFRNDCMKCGEPYSAEPGAREAQAL